MPQLIIANTGIKQDNEGRYCLNDLHKAAGGERKQRPYYWLQLAQVAKLIGLVEKAGNSAITTKRGVGTFVHKRLVYSYAMWISPEFQLEVVDAYDTLQTQGVAVATHAAEDLLNNPLKYMERLLGQAKDLQAQNLILQQEKTEAVDVATVAVQTIGKVQRSLREVARKLPY